jgi:hypothetical protein
MLAVMNAGNLIAQPATPVTDVVGSDVVTDEVGLSSTHPSPVSCLQEKPSREA